MWTHVHICVGERDSTREPQRGLPSCKLWWWEIKRRESSSLMQRFKDSVPVSSSETQNTQRRWPTDPPYLPPAARGGLFTLQWKASRNTLQRWFQEEHISPHIICTGTKTVSILVTFQPDLMLWMSLYIPHCTPVTHTWFIAVSSRCSCVR